MANLTNQELSSIKDQLNQELTLISKFTVYSQTITDKHLSDKCREIADRHQQHYNKLMSKLC